MWESSIMLLSFSRRTIPAGFDTHGQYLWGWHIVNLAPIGWNFKQIWSKAYKLGRSIICILYTCFMISYYYMDQSTLHKLGLKVWIRRLANQGRFHELIHTVTTIFRWPYSDYVGTWPSNLQLYLFVVSIIISMNYVVEP